jgi:hypothetical protein
MLSSKIRKKQTLRFKSKDHLNWVRGLGCAIQCHDCNGPIQAHHLMKPWHGERGMGMKSDDANVIPLCHKHHSMLHTQYGDEYKFFTTYTDQEDYGKSLAKALWEESEYGERKRDSGI